MYGYSKDCLTLIPFRLPQISCFTLSLKCFSPDSDNCPSVGIRPLLQFLYPLRAGPVLLTLPFLPQVASSYQVFGGSIYSFPLVRYSCPEFCMHFYVWRCIPECIHGERRTPRPPTPPPSCSPQLFGFLLKYPQTCSARHLVFCIQVYIFFTRFIYR